jgi:hypothetical protein
MSKYSSDTDHVNDWCRLMLETLVDLRRRSAESLVGDGRLRLRFGLPLDYALAGSRGVTAVRQPTAQ